MKAEHRKELEENVLAHKVGSFWSLITSNSPQATIVWGAILVGLLAILAYRYYGVYATESRSQLWTSLDMASDVADLKKIAAEKGEPGRIAKYHLARVYMSQGLSRIASSSAEERKSAVEDLEESRKIYTELASSGSDVPLLREEAMLEAGKAEESLAIVPKGDTGTAMRGSLDDALKQYDLLVKTSPDSFRGKEAAARAKDIRDRRGEVTLLYSELMREINPPPAPIVPKIDISPDATPSPPGPVVPKP